MISLFLVFPKYLCRSFWTLVFKNCLSRMLHQNYAALYCVLSILNWTSSVKILWFICDYLLKTLSHFSTGGQHYVTNPRRCWSKCYWELITLLSQLWSRYIDINPFLSWCARTENIIPGDFCEVCQGGVLRVSFVLLGAFYLFLEMKGNRLILSSFRGNIFSEEWNFQHILSTHINE